MFLWSKEMWQVCKPPPQQTTKITSSSGKHLWVMYAREMVFTCCRKSNLTMYNQNITQPSYRDFTKRCDLN